MSDTIIVALVSLAGTMVGTFSGILTSQKLSNYRIQELEKKVDKHNSFAVRVPVLEEQMKVANHRIEDLEALERGQHFHEG